MSTKRPPVLDPPQVTRRRRVLTEDERVLWDSVAKQTKPLRKRTKVMDAVVVAVTPKPVSEKVPARKSVTPPKTVKPALDAPKIAPPLAAIARREKSSLSRGKTRIEARIDLHGMTQHRAYNALQSFLHRAHHDGMAFVLVITGKGRTVGPESERGILRRQVPLWLSLPEFRTLVVGYEEAGVGHGGEGALYVRVRRAR